MSNLQNTNNTRVFSTGAIATADHSRQRAGVGRAWGRAAGQAHPPKSNQLLLKVAAHLDFLLVLGHLFVRSRGALSKFVLLAFQFENLGARVLELLV